MSAENTTGKAWENRGLDRAENASLTALLDLSKSNHSDLALNSCFTEAGFTPELLEPEPSSPQADTVELTA